MRTLEDRTYYLFQQYYRNMKRETSTDFLFVIRQKGHVQLQLMSSNYYWELYFCKGVCTGMSFLSRSECQHKFSLKEWAPTPFFCQGMSTDIFSVKEWAPTPFFCQGMSTDLFFSVKEWVLTFFSVKEWVLTPFFCLQ